MAAEGQTQGQPAPGPVEQPSLEDRIADQFLPPDDEQAEQAPEAEEAQADSEAAEESAKPAEPAPALEEVEWDGVKLGAYPKETAEKVRSALMAQKDYTVKTQEIAEQRRMVDMRAQALQLEGQFQQSVSQELQQLSQLDFQIAQYKTVNWAALNTEEMMRAKMALDTLKEERAKFAGQIQGKRAEFDKKQAAVRAKARADGEAYLKKNIPTWGPDVQKELTSYGISEGYSDVELGNLNDPRVVKTMWKASQWDKLQSQKGSALREAAKAPPVLKPGASTQQTAKATEDATYRKSLREAKTPGERAQIIQRRFAKKLGL